MLHFTAAGAVSSPTTLQVRLTRRFPGRVPAGAPAPTRSLDERELLDNLRHFTLGMRGPRTRPCTSLVLSGVELDRRTGLVEAVREARGWGIERVTLHLGGDDRDALARSPVGRLVDAVAVSVASEADLADVAALLSGPGRPGGGAVDVTAVVVLDDAGLARIDGLTAGLVRVRPRRVVFTWPFPPASPPPRADRVAGALVGPVQALDAAGVPCGIKGLPACRLGALGTRLWRSGNRWYVDADHQGAGALLFFPDVVRFAKDDICRWCAAAERCDGAPEAWLRTGRAGVLRPIDA